MCRELYSLLYACYCLLLLLHACTACVLCYSEIKYCFHTSQFVFFEEYTKSHKEFCCFNETETEGSVILCCVARRCVLYRLHWLFFENNLTIKCFKQYLRNNDVYVTYSTNYSVILKVKDKQSEFTIGMANVM